MLVTRKPPAPSRPTPSWGASGRLQDPLQRRALADPLVASSPVQRAAPGAVVQRYTIDNATALVISKYKGWKNWFFETCVPAMTTIAARAGQDFDQYLAGMSAAQFETELVALHTEAADDRAPGFWRGWGTDPIIQSGAYPDMMNIRGTNILVHPAEVNSRALARFVASYNTGTLQWYRGMAVSHFAYGQVKESGVLGSEGTADKPTFTMGNASPTRWLPGIYSASLADGLAHSVSSADTGIRDLVTRKIVPIGVTVEYPVHAPMHVAYLNDGEQVVRGPIRGMTVYRLVLMGPHGFSYKLVNGNTSDLPPPAPYNAGPGSAAIAAWEGLVDTWMANHP